MGRGVVVGAEVTVEVGETGVGVGCAPKTLQATEIRTDKPAKADHLCRGLMGIPPFSGFPLARFWGRPPRRSRCVGEQCRNQPARQDLDLAPSGTDGADAGRATILTSARGDELECAAEQLLVEFVQAFRQS